nr:MAG TPA: hypothetical protein [Caudoviricetes sp.]
MVARRPPWEVSSHCRVEPAQVGALTPQQVRRVCTADSVSTLAGNPHMIGADRRRWHGLRYAALSGMDPRQGRTSAPLYTLL